MYTYPVRPRVRRRLAAGPPGCSGAQKSTRVRVIVSESNVHGEGSLGIRATVVRRRLEFKAARKRRRFRTE